MTTTSIDPEDSDATRVTEEMSSTESLNGSVVFTKSADDDPFLADTIQQLCRNGWDVVVVYLSERPGVKRGTIIFTDGESPVSRPCLATVRSIALNEEATVTPSPS